MADKGKTEWKLDLDIKEFTEKALKAQGTVQGIGDSKNLIQFTKQIVRANRALVLLGAVAAALKVAFDTVWAAEEIKAVNQQFEAIIENTGLAADSIRNDLVTAADGLADGEQLLKSASEQALLLGKNASKLGDIMELAKKQTNAFGGDMIQNFEQISFAVATGNTRLLQRMGIMVDQEKAQIAYAKSIGKTISMLSQEERQRATLNAVLEKGKQSLDGISEDTKEATLGWERLKNTMGELKNQIIITFEKTMGPTVKRMISNMTVLAKITSDYFKDNFGAEAEQASARAEKLAKKVNKLRATIGEMEELQRKNEWSWAFGHPRTLKARIHNAKRILKEQEALFKKAWETKKKYDTKGKDAGPGDDTPTEDLKAIEAQKLRFEKELRQIRKQRLQQQIDDSHAYIDEEGNMQFQADVLMYEKKLMLKQEYEAQIQSIEDNKDLLGVQKKQMMMEREIIFNEQMKNLNQELTDLRIANMERYADKAGTMSEGIGRRFQVESMKAKKDMVNWGKTGKVVFNSFKKNATNAFLAMGDGSMKAGEAIKSAMFNVVADTAQAKGQEMMLAGIWPPNPPAIAGGAALIALAGFLRSKAGGGSEMGGYGGGGGGGSVSAAETPEPPEVEKAKQKTVSVNIAGSYYETEETRTRLMEMIRESGDFTDFNLKQIGQV